MWSLLLIPIYAYVLVATVLFTLGAILPKNEGIHPTEDHVLLQCDSCRMKSGRRGLCTGCRHNKWVAKELDLPFGGMEDLPLKRN